MSSHTPPDADSGKLYEYFEEALGLFHAGKPYDSVLSRCPAHLRAELRKQVELATRLVTLSPTMAQPRNQTARSQQRAVFMREVHKLQPQPVVYKGAVTPGVDSIRKVLQEFADRLANLTPRLTPQAVPLLVVLSLLLGSTIGVGTAAASALPGDFTYPVKEFAREARKNLASIETKEKVVQEIENERRLDNEQAAIERSNLITVTQDLVFYQKGDSVLDIGGQSVLRGYPSGTGEQLKQMEYVGDPTPGALVRLTYMIVPGKPNFVYGVKLEVLQAAPVPTLALASPSQPTATATAIPQPIDPTPIPTLPTKLCEPTRPEGWIVYRIQPDDNLTSMAIKMSTPYAQVLDVNCRTDEDLSVGVSIFLPAYAGVTVPDTNGGTEIPTATPVASYTPTATVDETATPEVETSPTGEVEPSPVAPTEEATIVETPVATEEGSDATATPEATEIVPTSDVTPEVTPTSESTIVETPVATITEEPSTTPTESVATPTSEVEATATSLPNEPTVEPTAEVVATPTLVEATSEPVATTEPPPVINTPVEIPTVEATLAPSPEPTVQSSSIGDPTPIATQPVSPLFGFAPKQRIGSHKGG